MKITLSLLALDTFLYLASLFLADLTYASISLLMQNSSVVFVGNYSRQRVILFSTCVSTSEVMCCVDKCGPAAACGSVGVGVSCVVVCGGGSWQCVASFPPALFLCCVRV